MASATASAAKKKLVAAGYAKQQHIEGGMRSGTPHWSSVSSSQTPPDWSEKVSWQKGDILDPKSYTQHLEGADAVIHTMGILLEADYKGVVSGRESPIKGLQRAFSKTKAGTQNPLELKEGEVLKPQECDGQLTYEIMNRDTAVSLAREASTRKVPTYLYISAAAGTPILPARYITTKREAESIISTTFPTMRSIFIRAPFLYDSSRSFTLPIAAAGGVASMINSAVGGRLTWLMGAGGIKPLKADLVGEAVVEALEDEDVRGPVEVPEIERLGTRAWRKNMV
ncbi:hypothetical protein CFE70_002585 [Pyrenophora teres f. teres 0-1]